MPFTVASSLCYMTISCSAQNVKETEMICLFVVTRMRDGSSPLFITLIVCFSYNNTTTTNSYRFDLKISIECLQIWRICLQYGLLEVDSFSTMFQSVFTMTANEQQQLLLSGSTDDDDSATTTTYRPLVRDSSSCCSALSSSHAFVLSVHFLPKKAGGEQARIACLHLVLQNLSTR